ncbi:PilW family protein [Clostridioides sp. GD02377]|uniref:PilW family protein n=1 Tax=unclassified Clostridioides TaxID=2635829 RepID=UPI0038ACE573
MINLYKNNEKGLTLLEIIVAVFILTIVLSISYKVFNGITLAVKKQQIITDAQVNVNLINKYLNRDLENCKEVTKASSGSNYEYNIETPDNIVRYEVSIETKNNTGVYSVTRIQENTSDADNAVREEIISNQPLVQNNKEMKETPFKIEKQTDKYIYTVSIYYNESTQESQKDSDLNNKTYTFDVMSRIG